MSTLEQKQKRSEQARINGAKSKGPKTPEGLKRAQTASLNHGLYATTDTLRHTVDPRLFEEFRAEILKIWNPENYYIARRVNQLIAAMWESERLQAVRRQLLTDLFATESDILNLELLVSVKGSPMDRIDSRLRRLNLEISRTERDLLRLKKSESIVGPSHNSLKTRINTPEPSAPETAVPSQTTPSPTVPCYREPLRQENSGKVPAQTSPKAPPRPPKPPDTAPRS
jgi:hypothetical protein